MASFSVRAASLLDLPVVVRLAKYAAEETEGWFGWTSDEAAARRFAALITGAQPGWILLAEKDCKVFPAGVLVTSAQPQQRAAMGEYLYVKSDERGAWNGALAALLREHRKIVRGLGFTEEVVLAAPSRAKFWQDHGYDLKSVVLSRTMTKKEKR